MKYLSLGISNDNLNKIDPRVETTITDCADKEGYQRNSCLRTTASDNDDLFICEAIDDTNQRKSCRSGVYQKIAIENLDANICDYIEEGYYKDSCYEKIAQLTGDATYCEKVGDVEDRDECYLEFILETGDVSLCDLVVTSEYQDACTFISIFYSSDFNQCKNIQNKEYRWMCYHVYIGYTISSETCQTYEDAEDKFECYFESFENAEMTDCDKVDEIEYRDECYLNFIERDGDLSQCDLIITPSIRDECKGVGDSKRVADIKQIQTALELYFNDNNEYPETPTQGQSLGIDVTCLGEDGFDTSCSGTVYFGLIPKDPQGTDLCTSESTSSCNYSYERLDGSTNEYEMWFYLNDEVGSLSAGLHCADEAGITATCSH